MTIPPSFVVKAKKDAEDAQCKADYLASQARFAAMLPEIIDNSIQRMSSTSGALKVRFLRGI
jgi:hypothetical protein